MTRFLATSDNPSGWRLEDILSEIQSDIIRRSGKILDDTRPEARKVLRNNIDILGWLVKCIEKAEDSTHALNSIGPSKAAEGGPPRIGKT
jgi:hypothetical protein